MTFTKLRFDDYLEMTHSSAFTCSRDVLRINRVEC
jgi:hypothetical protein